VVRACCNEIKGVSRLILNALRKHDNMVTPHPLYQALAETLEKRREMHIALFDQEYCEVLILRKK